MMDPLTTDQERGWGLKGVGQSSLRKSDEGFGRLKNRKMNPEKIVQAFIPYISFIPLRGLTIYRYAAQHQLKFIKMKTTVGLVWITLVFSWDLPLVLGLDAWVFSLQL